MRAHKPAADSRFSRHLYITTRIRVTPISEDPGTFGIFGGDVRSASHNTHVTLVQVSRYRHVRGDSVGIPAKRVDDHGECDIHSLFLQPTAKPERCPSSEALPINKHAGGCFLAAVQFSRFVEVKRFLHQLSGEVELVVLHSLHPDTR